MAGAAIAKILLVTPLMISPRQLIFGLTARAVK